jgi:hypothetical protein
MTSEAIPAAAVVTLCRRYQRLMGDQSGRRNNDPRVPGVNSELVRESLRIRVLDRLPLAGSGVFNGLHAANDLVPTFMTTVEGARSFRARLPPSLGYHPCR